MGKDKNTVFWKQKVWNRRWEIWSICSLVTVLSFIAVYLMFIHFYAQQPVFFVNETIPPDQICHRYNDKIYCCAEHPRITVYTNMSKTVVENYICKAIRIKRLKEPFLMEIDADLETLEYE